MSRNTRLTLALLALAGIPLIPHALAGQEQRLEEIVVTDEPMLSMFAPRVSVPRPEKNAPQSNIIYIDA